GLALGHRLGPCGDALVHERPPEGLGVHGLGLRHAQHAKPRLTPLLHLLLPHVEELLTGVRHAMASYDLAASHEATLGQQCTDAPRPAMREMWPPANSTYSRSTLATAPMRGFTQAGGAMLSSFAPIARTGQRMLRRLTGRPPMRRSPRIARFCW